MVKNSLGVTLLLAVSIPAIAQYVATPPPGETPADSANTRSDTPFITPNNGQTQDQLWADRYQCDRWATSQSGFDPSQHTASGPSNDNAAGREQYKRALTACLEGRGYTVRYGVSPTAAPPPPSAGAPQQRRSAPTFVRDYVREMPALRYHPFAFGIEGGYSLTTGTTNHYLDDGPNVGFGLTWFPTSALPIGLRVDGSYSRFDAKDALLNYSGVGYSYGHENIYGGDADLQLDLAHRSSGYKLYLFGGAGWYREQTRLKQVSFEQGFFCDYYFCGLGYGPVVTAEERTTSPWRSSWNSGLGWEIAFADGASFFLEARYQRIGSRDNKLQFVPIRVGLRF
jgi:opacity protein-like surface antigen